DLVLHRWRRGRPGTTHQALLLGCQVSELLAEAVDTTSLDRAHHARICSSVVLLEVRRIEDTENSFECLRADGEDRQQVTHSVRQFVPGGGWGQTARRRRSSLARRPRGRPAGGR